MTGDVTINSNQRDCKNILKKRVRVQRFSFAVLEFIKENLCNNNSVFLCNGHISGSNDQNHTDNLKLSI